MAVRTVVLGERPPQLQALIEQRRALGLDVYDEVWGGEYHMSPPGTDEHAELQARLIEVLAPRARAAGLRMTGPVNIGAGPQDFRVPDAALLDPGAGGTWLATARLVAEVLSPDDETYTKFGFYAAHQVPEIVVVDPDRRLVELWALARDGAGYIRAPASMLLGVTDNELAVHLGLT